MALERDLRKLETRIRKSIKDIEDFKSTPAKSGIGKSLMLMKKFDEVLYLELMELYKPVFTEFKEKHPNIK